MKSTPKLLTLIALMVIFAGCTTKIDGPCPYLAPPPLAAVDALQAARDANVDVWVVGLSRHYKKLGECGA